MKAIIYARKSSLDGDRKSLIAQIEACQAYCQAHGYEVAGIYQEQNISGRTYPTGSPFIRADEITREWCEEHLPRAPHHRPELAKALEALETADVLVIDEKTRLCRPVLGSSLETAIFQTIRIAEATVHQVSGGVIDPAKHTDDMVSKIQSNAEDKSMADKMRKAGKARKDRRDSGYLYRRPDCYGIETAGKQKVTIDPDCVPVIRQIFADYIAGHGLQHIARKLNADGVPTATGSVWQAAQIANILDRPQYAAHQEDTDGRLIPCKPLMAHEPIITLETFLEAQKARSNRTRSVGKNQIKPLSGLVYCGSCGSPMVYRSNGLGSSQYVCQMKIIHSASEHPNCQTMKVSDTPAWEVYGSDSALLPFAAHRLMQLRQEAKATTDQQAISTDLEAKLSQLAKKGKEILNAYMADALSIADMTVLKADIEKQTKALRIQKDEVQREISNAQTVETTDLYQYVDNLSAGELNQAFGDSVKSIIVHTQKVIVNLHNGGKVELPLFSVRSSTGFPGVVWETNGKITIHYTYPASADIEEGTLYSDSALVVDLVTI